MTSDDLSPAQRAEQRQREREQERKNLRQFLKAKREAASKARSSNGDIVISLAPPTPNRAAFPSDVGGNADAGNNDSNVEILDVIRETSRSPPPPPKDPRRNLSPVSTSIDGMLAQADHRGQTSNDDQHTQYTPTSSASASASTISPTEHRSLRKKKSSPYLPLSPPPSQPLPPLPPPDEPGIVGLGISTPPVHYSSPQWSASPNASFPNGHYSNAASPVTSYPNTPASSSSRSSHARPPLPPGPPPSIPLSSLPPTPNISLSSPPPSSLSTTSPHYDYPEPPSPAASDMTFFTARSEWPLSRQPSLSRELAELADLSNEAALSPMQTPQRRPIQTTQPDSTPSHPPKHPDKTSVHTPTLSTPSRSMMYSPQNRSSSFNTPASSRLQVRQPRNRSLSPASDTSIDLSKNDASLIMQEASPRGSDSDAEDQIKFFADQNSRFTDQSQPRQNVSNGRKPTLSSDMDDGSGSDTPLEIEKLDLDDSWGLNLNEPFIVPEDNDDRLDRALDSHVSPRGGTKFQRLSYMPRPSRARSRTSAASSSATSVSNEDEDRKPQWSRRISSATQAQARPVGIVNPQPRVLSKAKSMADIGGQAISQGLQRPRLSLPEESQPVRPLRKKMSVPTMGTTYEQDHDDSPSPLPLPGQEGYTPRFTPRPRPSGLRRPQSILAKTAMMRDGQSASPRQSILMRPQANSSASSSPRQSMIGSPVSQFQSPSASPRASILKAPRMSMLPSPMRGHPPAGSPRVRYT